MVVVSKEKSPYPGLRSFDAEEIDLFFGREQQVNELLDRLDQRRFLAVVGPSGCGKSSLVRAGLIGDLRSGMMPNYGSRWKIMELRPGSSPYKGLARAMIAESWLGYSATDPNSVSFLAAELKKGPLSVVKMLEEQNATNGANLLILVDQFEEIFRYRSEVDIDESEAFVAMLLESVRQSKVPIFVVLTMRSEYLGLCGLFEGLPEMLNGSQYLTPRLTRDQCRDAIEKPAKICGGELEEQLVNTLLNDFGSDPDQLPLLQHTLMRMWSLRGKDNKKLTLKDYEDAGSINECLSNHASEVYKQLTHEQQKIAEKIFRCLSDNVTQPVPVRRPTKIRTLSKRTGVPESAIIEVANKFRSKGNYFVAPPKGDLDSDSVIDITHESVMRQWKLLKGWMTSELTSARTYIWLSDSVRDNRGRLKQLDLRSAKRWLRHENPSDEWADMYLTKTGENRMPGVREYVTNSIRKQSLYDWGVASILLASLVFAFFYYRGVVEDERRRELENARIEATQENLEAMKRLNEDLTESNETSTRALAALQDQTEKTKAAQLLLAVQNRTLKDNNASLGLSNARNAELVESLKTQLALVRIQELSFYARLSGNVELRQAAINFLLPLEKTNDPGLKAAERSVELAAEAYAEYQTDPIAAMYRLRKADKIMHSPLIDYIVGNISSEVMFYKDKQPLMTPYYPAISPNLKFIATVDYSFERIDIYKLSGSKATFYDSIRMPEQVMVGGKPRPMSDETFENIRIENDGTVYSQIFRLVFDVRKKQGEELPRFIDSKKNTRNWVLALDRSAKYIVEMIGSDVLRLWKPSDIGNGAKPVHISCSSAISTYSMMENETQLLVVYTNGRGEIFDCSTGNSLAVLDILGNVKSGTIEITQAAAGYKRGEMIAIYKSNAVYLFRNNSLEEITHDVAGINRLSFSEDGKTLLGTGEGAYLIDIESKSYKIMNHEGSTNLARFLPNGDILTLDDAGWAYTWTMQPAVTTLEMAFSELRIPSLPIYQQVERSLLDVDDIIKFNTDSLLEGASAYFNVNYDRDSTLKIYKALEGRPPLTTAQKILYYEGLNSVDLFADSIDYDPILERMKFIARNTEDKIDVELKYADLEYYQLVARRYNDAIESGKEALKKVEDPATHYSNMIVGYLALENVTEARKILSEHKDIIASMRSNIELYDETEPYSLEAFDKLVEENP